MKRIIEVDYPMKCPYRTGNIHTQEGQKPKPGLMCQSEGDLLCCEDYEFPEDCPLNCNENEVEKIVKASGLYSGRVFLPGAWVGKLVRVVLLDSEKKK